MFEKNYVRDSEKKFKNLIKFQLHYNLIPTDKRIINN